MFMRGSDAIPPAGVVVETKPNRRGWRIFAVCLALALTSGAALQAALVDLDALVTYAIYDNSGSTALANGAVVYIIGSANPTVNPMQIHPTGGTNYIANNTTGDDVILGITTINSLNTGSNGTFFTTVQYESTQINYVYIRFFDYTNNIPIGGLVYWGNSAIHQLGSPTLGVNSVDFNPGATLTTSNHNNFVVVPEPSTANLLILVAGMAWAMRASMKGKRKPGADTGAGLP